ncbi:Maf family protein [Paludisphaera rhizosphaerae]|uniref:Maf family protein n=1 Tax=Paludisphaera rhizosphaerae TaxID=2711216 RepID=UPI0013E9CB1B|nr:nucleoside triphosphate pyrophosphatase [Paludisphaera rhizosphaerae]
MSRAALSELILASTSTYRRALVERLGLRFRCEAPPFDEAAFPREGLSPRALAEALARGKAESVFNASSNAVVIGSDQLVSFQGRVFGKPGTAAGAVEQLAVMSGKAHELITAMVVIAPERRFEHTDVTRLTMRTLDRPAIERYVERDRPLDCAGSYKLEQGGVTLFDRIESEDQTAITGLPLLALTRILAELGFNVP